MIEQQSEKESHVPAGTLLYYFENELGDKKASMHLAPGLYVDVHKFHDGTWTAQICRGNDIILRLNPRFLEALEAIKAL